MRRFACLSVTTMPLSVAVTAALLLVAAVVYPVVAHADSGSDSRFVSATNSARSSHGLHDYAVAGDLTSVARRWAAHMAAHRDLAHNPSFGREVCCWTQLGENVGEGSTVSQIQRAFMASSPHRANILSRSYTQVGIGTARGSDGKLYVDELFRRPTRSAAAPHTAAQSAAHRSVTVAPQARVRTVTRASRSAVRRPRLPVAHRRATLSPLPQRMALARRVASTGYADPVGGALAYLRVVRLLGAPSSGSARH